MEHPGYLEVLINTAATSTPLTTPQWKADDHHRFSVCGGCATVASMKNDSTIISSWALVQCNVIRHVGLSPEQFYSDEGLDINATKDPQQRFPAEPFNRIWYRLSRESGDPSIGLTAAQFVLPTTFHALGLAMWSSPTALEALQRLVRFSRIVNDGGGGALEINEKEVRFVITRDRNASNVELMTDIGIDCLCGSLVSLFGQLSGEAIYPQVVYLKHPQPDNAHRYRDYYQCPVHFDADQDVMIFDREQLQKPLASGNEELAAMNDTAAASYLSRIENDDTLHQLHQRIIHDLSGGEISQEKIAADMAMSVRTLQRTLKQRDTSFKQELDQVRKSLAREYLQQPELTLGEVSYLLGFTQPNNFSRSFKQWYNTSPSQYRIDKLGFPDKPNEPI